MSKENIGPTSHQKTNNQDIKSSSIMAPVYYSGPPQDKAIPHNKPQINSYQHQLPPMQMEADPPLPHFLENSNQNNFRIHKGKLAAFMVTMGYINFFLISSNSSCDTSCSLTSVSMFIYMLACGVYLLINLIISQMNLKEISPICMYLFTYPPAHCCETWLGILAAILIIFYCPVTFIMFLYHATKKDAHQEIVSNNITT